MPRVETDAPETFLVEHYRPGLTPDELRAYAARVRDATTEMKRAGKSTRYVSATIESFELPTPDLLETRVLPADNGIWYGTCTRRAVCPYPAPRFARPAEDLVPRRLALELALRTFLETSVDVVGVSLPTAQFTALIVERTELAREVDLTTLAGALAGDPSRPLAASLARVVDRVTAPRVFVGVGLKPTPSGRESWVGVPRWPDFTG